MRQIWVAPPRINQHGSMLRDANGVFASLTLNEMPRKRDGSGLCNGEAVRDMRGDTLEEEILTCCSMDRVI